MRKCILSLFVVLFLLTGCRGDRLISGEAMIDSIEIPDNALLPIEGSWIVRERRENANNRQTLPSFGVDDALYVSRDVVGIRDFFTVKPSLSSKYVNLKNYLETRYQDLKELPGYEEENVLVLMVRDNDNFTLDIMKLEENRIAIFYESCLYILEKTSDVVAQETVADFRAKASSLAIKQRKDPENLNLSTLIGIKRENVTENGDIYYSYYTYLISDDYRFDTPRVFEVSDLLFFNDEMTPFRMRYQVEEMVENLGPVRGTFTYESLVNPTPNSQSVLEDTYQRSITFLHNNIVAFDLAYPAQNPLQIRNEFEIFGVDSMERGPYSVDTLAGEESRVVVKDRIFEQLDLLDPEGSVDRSEEEVNYSNIGIIRQNASWGYTTGKTWTIGGTTYPVRIPIDLATPVPIIPNDTLKVPWSRVTTKLPLARTAFSSTNGERLLVFTDDEIQYFKTYGKRIGGDAQLSIQLPANCSVVMVEHYYDAAAEKVNTVLTDQSMLLPQVIYTGGEDSLRYPEVMSK